MLGDKLVALRKKNGHSQQELADKLQVTRQTLKKYCKKVNALTIQP
ncbi:MAG: helix-turn-helix transcriptional regulator [Lachnospiraceae bacterium]|nr:helix-turn-helix transcriptional regulator [Lachnospiraceae bacterium]